MFGASVVAVSKIWTFSFVVCRLAAAGAASKGICMRALAMRHSTLWLGAFVWRLFPFYLHVCFGECMQILSLTNDDCVFAPSGRAREGGSVCVIEHFLTSLESFHYGLSASYSCAAIISCETLCLHTHMNCSSHCKFWTDREKKTRKTVSHRTDLFFHLHHSSYVHAFISFMRTKIKCSAVVRFLVLQTEKYLRLLCTYFSVGVICIFQCMKKK